MSNSLSIRDLSPMAYAMTRIAAKAFGGQVATIFSPGQPVAPVAHEARPRQFQYPVAVNMAQLPRRDYPGLTPFETLRYLAKKHPLAALCIRVRCEQIAMLPGAYVAKRPSEQASLQADCDALNLWMDQPDRHQNRVAWLSQLIRDMLEIDAPTIYRRPSRGGGLYGLDIVDGATIKPILDIQGRTVAYQQVIYGLALSQYLGRPAGPDEDQIIGEYAPGEIWYQPYNVQTVSPYGRAPMEDMLEQASIYLQKQGYDLGHFTEGNIPGAIAVLDPAAGLGSLNVEQVSDFEDNFNAVLQGDVARGVKLKFVPFPMKVERLQELSTGGQYESDWEERMVKMTCAFYGVTPSEIGFTADVNKSTGDSQENVTYRRAKALTQWLKLCLFDPVAHHDFNYPSVEWQWNYGESEDLASLASSQQADIAAGVITAQESRSMRYPDLEGQAPGPPQPAGQPGLLPPPPLPVVKGLAKRDGDPEAPEDEAARLAAEASYAELIAGIFAAQLARARAAIESTEALSPDLGGFWLAEQATMTKELTPIYTKVLAEAAEQGAAQVAIGVDWELVNLEVLKLARLEAATLAAQLTGTSKAGIAAIIEDWISTGGTLKELSQRIAAVYPQVRAKTIAATEVTRLYARGNALAWQGLKVVSQYQWQTAMDERVCPLCGPLHGQVFDKQDLSHLPPVHPNCRCWIVPIVLSAKDLSDGG